MIVTQDPAIAGLGDPSLSTLESKVAALVAQAYTNAQIAVKLGYAEVRSVRHVISNACDKLHLDKTSERRVALERWVWRREHPIRG